MNEWDKTSVGDLIHRYGGSIKTGPFGTALKASEYTATGVPVISVGEIGYGRFRLSRHTPRVDTTVTERLTEYLLESGDIVFGRKGAVDRSVLVTNGEAGWFLGSDGIRLRLPKNVDHRYIFYSLSSKTTRAWLLQQSTGSTMASLNQGIIARLPLSLPPRHVQESISAVLGALDDKIDLNRQMNETLEAMAQAIFRDWFIDFGPVRRKMEGATDPVAIIGGVTTDPARAAELAALFPNGLAQQDEPIGWHWGTAEDLIEFNPSSPLRKGTSAPYLEMAALPTTGSTADAPVERPFGSGMRFTNGDALLARITPCLENGKACFVDVLPEGAVGWGSTEFFVLRARPPCPPPMGYLLCRDPDFRTLAVQSMTGTSGRQRAQLDMLKAWPMVIPPEPVLRAFGTFVEPLFAKITAAAAENRTLAETRDYLLPRLMSGEVRVREAEDLAEAAAA